MSTLSSLLLDIQKMWGLDAMSGLNDKPHEQQDGDDEEGRVTIAETIGPWRIISELGRGGMGVVCMARHMETGQQAALKVLRDRPTAFVIKSLRAEIEALEGLRHPNVVKLLGHGTHRNAIPWMAMELVAGHS
ncbi:MAG: protein kinase, partial [Myxococcota bacterium]